MERDYSHLPDVVWVGILTYLPLADKSAVARTCNTLYDIFHHPSLWKDVVIHLLGDSKPYRSKINTPLIIAEKPVKLTQKFGMYFQNLTLRLSGFLKIVPEDCAAILKALSHDCRLEKLILEVGTMVTQDPERDAHSVIPKHRDLELFSDLIRNAFRLKSFTLTSWPRFHGVETLDILQQLIQNEKLIHLEALSLYWFSVRQGTWTTNNALLPSPDEVLRLVAHFQHLTTLRLRTSMINDEIIEKLAKPRQKCLKYLSVLVTYTNLEQANEVGDIYVSSKAWSTLSQSCPDLQVDFTVMRRVPSHVLASILKPEILMTAVNFMRYSRCGAADIQNLTDNYCKILTKFINYSDTLDCDQEVITMVEVCTRMDRFIYNGTLRYETVLKLAQLRGTQWREFNVNIDHITTSIVDEELDNDDDTVLRLGADGQYNTPITRTYQPEDDREQILNNLTQQISQCLGYNWKPFTEKTMFQS